MCTRHSLDLNHGSADFENCQTGGLQLGEYTSNYTDYVVCEHYAQVHNVFKTDMIYVYTTVKSWFYMCNHDELNCYMNM